MTRPVLLLVHGWGFNAGFWEPLRAALGPVDSVAWDLGFGGTPDQPPLPAGRPVVAVGHSFGLLWLLHERPLTWRRLVSINGFPRFTAAPGYPGLPTRPLSRMITRLGKAFQAVHDDFLTRCGAPAAGRIAVDRLDPGRLSWGLHALAEWDGRETLQSAGAEPPLVLAGRGDPIVPPAMTLAAFTGSPVRWHDDGHLLPLTAPDWCAGHLRSLVESL